MNLVSKQKRLRSSPAFCPRTARHPTTSSLHALPHPHHRAHLTPPCPHHMPRALSCPHPMPCRAEHCSWQGPQTSSPSGCRSQADWLQHPLTCQLKPKSPPLFPMEAALRLFPQPCVLNPRMLPPHLVRKNEDLSNGHPSSWVGGGGRRIMSSRPSWATARPCLEGRRRARGG